MVQINEDVSPRRHHPNLILHCGAQAVKREQVVKVNTPRATETWTPIPHAQLITTVEETLSANHLTIGSQAHSLTHDGARYFGLMEISNHDNAEDYCWVLGLRNSHDKRFAAHPRLTREAVLAALNIAAEALRADVVYPVESQAG